MTEPQFDPFSALMADEPTAQQMALARAAALRGQNFAGMVAGLAHEPGLQRQGPELMQQAQQGMEQLGALPGARLQQAMERQKMQQQGPQEALGGQTPSTFELLTKREQVPKYAATYPGAQIYNQKTGELGPTPPGGAPGLLDPAALDQAAEMFNTTGKLPPGIMRGPAGAAIGRQIANRAAELHPDANLATNQASFGGDTASLKKLQVQADSVNAFENTALKNLDMFLQQAHGIVDVGSPLFNAPARKFMQAVAGDPKMTAFNVSRQVAVQEISKVLGGGLGSAAVSDSARHEVEGLIGPDASLAQIEKAAEILKADMANRRTSFTNQIAEVHGRMSGKKTAAAPEGGPPPAAAPAQATPTDTAALAWLKANPAHAAASVVAAKLKAKGLLP